jgi:hypothetical protein
MTNLFAVAGMDLPASGGGKTVRAISRSLRQPLFNLKTLDEAINRDRALFSPTGEQTATAKAYAKRAKSARFQKQSEVAVRPIFISEVLVKLLGYAPLDPESAYTLAYEHPIRSGAVDVALGDFGRADGKGGIIAPFELKGPGTIDLDAVMPGRGRSPVQQAWDYAIDAPGSKWVLVSNCLGVRLYGFGRGRDAYEVFDRTRLDEEDKYERLWLMLSARRFLDGSLDKLLRESDSAYKDVTNKLYIEFKGLRDRLIDFLVDSADGPKLPFLRAIETAQKLLDRILFIAFAQRTDLLPDKLLDRAAKAINEFDPQPIWTNFRSLFRRVDVGHANMAIPPYNGGLFAEDDVADTLTIPDPLAGEMAALGEWDYRREVPVTVLGHIFEQSISDIERMKAESRGEEPPTVSKRKRQGVVYTPDNITRFLCERTIGLTLKETFEALWQKYGLNNSGAPENELAFWHEYLDALRAMRIVDPACGSGAFLVAAFDLLAGEYHRTIARVETLGGTIDFDSFDEIVTKNLYGVDLNAESVEITRLSLWLKTARRDHRLQNLEATIKTGDSLIEDKAFTERPFDWRAAFADVFAQGGFDIVIGNPPYVRMEFIKPFKPYLEEHYVVAADRADLYAYFFEREANLLKEGGRLGYISSSTFFRTGSGENLRTFLTDDLAIEAVVDFGDLQIFEGVTTYPAILTLRKAKEENGELAYLKIGGVMPAELGRTFDEEAQKMPRARLGKGSWRLEGDALARLRDKIAKGRKTLGEVYGAPLRGIVTGLNEAFVIDTETRNRLVKADPKSADLLKPFLRGENIKRWRVEPEGLWLINTPKGKVNIEDYPAIRDWLLPFKDQLEKRATKQEWWELQQAQLAYHNALESTKIVFPDMSQGPKFTLDSSNGFCGNTAYFIPSDDAALLGYMNSTLFWWFVFGLAEGLRGGQWRLLMFSEHLAQLPIPASEKSRQSITKTANTATTAARTRYDIISQFRRRILDLAPPERRKLNTKLENWHDSDFTAFQAEIKKAFKTTIPVKERGEWEKYLVEQSAEVARLTAEIEAAEKDIDAIVYNLFDLTPDEINLLEASIAGQK